MLLALIGSSSLALRAVPIIQQSVDQTQDSSVQNSRAPRALDQNFQMNILRGQVLSEKEGLMSLHRVWLRAAPEPAEWEYNYKGILPGLWVTK